MRSVDDCEYIFFFFLVLCCCARLIDVSENIKLRALKVMFSPAVLRIDGWTESSVTVTLLFLGSKQAWNDVVSVAFSLFFIRLGGMCFES